MIDAPDHDEIDFPALQGTLAGTWSIEREIGRGGMGVVYLARDVSLDRPVAIKVLHPRLARRAEARDRFLAEARTGGRLSHPHVVPIYSVDATGDIVYFVMGLVDGESLGAQIRRAGPLAASQATAVIREVGWALAHAHAMGVLHRDVTLDNVLIERRTGHAFLVDFGIAAEVERTHGVSLVGTPAYIAPELIHGEPPSVQSDLYALAVMSWATLAGRLPFDGPDNAATLMLHVTADIPSLASAAPATPSRVVRAIERSLSKNPAGRPIDTEEFIAALDQSTTVATVPPALHRWVTRGQRIRPAWAFAAPLAGMLAFIAMMGAGSYLPDMLPRAIPSLLVLGGAGVLHAWFAQSELRRVLRSGYGSDDLALAMKQQRVSTVSKPAPLLGRVVHDLGTLAVLGIVLGAIVFTTVMRVDTQVSWEALMVIVELMGWCWITLWTAIGAEFVLQCHPVVRRMKPGLSERFWASRLGRAAARIVGVGLPATAEAGHTLHRPTELMLSLAIEDLWSALPDEPRKAMQDAPGIASGLRRRVAELKEALRVIDSSAARPVAEFTAIRQRLAERHEAGVTALERIRLLLIRLGGAAASAGEFTAQLEDARAVERSLLEELGAHPGLWKQLKSGLRNASPTPTPAG